MLTSTMILLVVVVMATAVNSLQSFREVPQNKSAIIGEMVRLHCRVDNIQGIVQWTRKGFTLGFERGIPGWPRLSMQGDSSAGINDLVISDVQLEDDGVYECQVGPASGAVPLSASCYVTVHVVPSSVDIVGYVNGTTVKVPHEQPTLNLTCVASGGKPAANITWKRNDGDLSASTVVNTTVETLPNKTQNTVSSLTIIPGQADNNAIYTCSAINEAFGEPMETTVLLSVMHPPGAPVIDNYSTGQIKHTGETMMLVCTSRGGNPLAQVYWYRNGIQLDFSYVSGNGKAVNELIFEVQPQDNEAVYRCEASNLVTDQPLVAEVELSVYFAPEYVRVTGHQNAKYNETATLTCESAISNPPTQITWYSRGAQLEGASQEVKPSSRGGFITTSQIHVYVTSSDDQVNYHCMGSVAVLKKDVSHTVTLEVLFPPKELSITGYSPDETLEAESVLLLTCNCRGGNPLATLTWWKDGEQLISSESVVNGGMVRNSISIHVKAEDNGETYYCNATNIATTTPLITNTILTVNFPPSHLNISIEPKYPKVGEEVTIRCASSSSNPASELSWLREGEDDVEGTIATSIKAAAFGGYSTISSLTMVPRVVDDNKIYACMATMKQHTVSDAVTLNVSYAPYFPPDIINSVNIVEGDWSFINNTALGNPPVTMYAWYRGEYRLRFGRLTRLKRDFSMPHFLEDKGVVNITGVSRRDAGMYIVEAANTIGKTNHTIKVNILYGPDIVRTSKSMIVDQGDTAVLECVIDANPLTETMVQWTRPNYNMSRVHVGFNHPISTLTIPNVLKLDSGIFVCSVNNNISVAKQANSELLVKYAPEIDRSPTYAKAAADRGSIATIICKAEGVPDVSFEWYKGQQFVNTSLPKYRTVFKKTGLVLYESQLKVHNTTLADYDTYNCRAINELGVDEKAIPLDGTSRPYAPFDVRISNVTHNSMVVMWKPGFDGGSLQWFQVRYGEVVEAGQLMRYKFEDVSPPQAFMYTLRDLKLNTDYTVSVRGKNRLGEGPFSVESVIQRTRVAPLTASHSGSDVPLIIILTVCIAGVILLAFNVLLILFFIRRRNKRLNASDYSSQAQSVEMYNAQTFDDSKSTATYDRKSIEGFNDDRFFDEKKLYGPSQGPSGADPYYGSRSNLPPAYGSGTGSYFPQEYDVSSVPLPGASSREPLYPTDSWGRDPYISDSIQRSLTLGPHPGETNDDEEYADQLRKMQQSITHDDIPPFPGPGPRPSVGSLGNMRGSKPRLNEPPIPSRNYNVNEMPRYTPAPGGGNYSRQSSEIMGALV